MKAAIVRLFVYASIGYHAVELVRGVIGFFDLDRGDPVVTFEPDPLFGAVGIVGPAGSWPGPVGVPGAPHHRFEPTDQSDLCGECGWPELDGIHLEVPGAVDR